ncbi:FRE family ferric-chelate reductase [Apiospora arundinis]
MFRAVPVDFAMAYHGATRIRVKTQGREVTLFPGCYFYISKTRSSWRHKLHSHPMNVIHWASSYNAAEGPLYTTSEFEFLIEDTGGLTVRTSDLLTLDGPYGRNLHVEDYEHIGLVAEGIGIVGVLPFITHILRRWTYDQFATENRTAEGPELAQQFSDQTRQIDLVWKLTDTSQQEWVAELIEYFNTFIRYFQEIDPLRVSSAPRLLLATSIDNLAESSLHILGVPCQPERPATLSTSDYVRCKYPRKRQKQEDCLQDAMGIVMSNTKNSGKSTVLTCGSGVFTENVRAMMIGNPHVRFAEVEYQPNSTALQATSQSGDRDVRDAHRAQALATLDASGRPAALAQTNTASQMLSAVARASLAVIRWKPTADAERIAVYILAEAPKPCC